MTEYNIYFGTIGKTLNVRYRYTKKFKTESEALREAKQMASSFYYKNEGTYNIPSYISLVKESKALDVPLETLYADHMWDLLRYYAIPTELDTIPTKKLKY